jgi:hypothetical protein
MPKMRRSLKRSLSFFPAEHLNIITMVASQGDMPQKLSGGGQGDRFIPLLLLADKNKGDFGEIVYVPQPGTTRKGVAELMSRTTTTICRKEFKFIKHGQCVAGVLYGDLPIPAHEPSM